MPSERRYRLVRLEHAITARMNTIRFELADGAPGARVLDGRWGLDQLASAIPTGRVAVMLCVDAIATGLVQRAANRAGVRGTLAAASVPK